MLIESRFAKTAILVVVCGAGSASRGILEACLGAKVLNNDGVDCLTLRMK